MKRIKTLLFDMDGTLVESWTALYKAIVFTQERLELPVNTYAQVMANISKGLQHFWSQILHSSDAALVDGAIEMFKMSFLDNFLEEIQPYPGVVDTLAYFRDKERIVVTSGQAEVAWRILRQKKLDVFIHDLIGGDDIACLKPVACPLEREMDKHEAEKESALMVGDMPVDIAAGKAAGVYTCAVTYGIGTPEELRAAEPDYMIEDFRELKNIVAK
jgi:phosphoglycolate phosphatase-like HAD superfamily hydrolase